MIVILIHFKPAGWIKEQREGSGYAGCLVDPLRLIHPTPDDWITGECI
jgi:hypothetical protein